MEYDIELKIKGKIDVKNIEDLKISVWDYFAKQFEACVFANDDSELRFVTVKEHGTDKVIDLEYVRKMLDRRARKARAELERQGMQDLVS